MKHAIFVLKSRRGASIILALIIFLLCALAGASALIMASANAGRYSHSEDDQQPYYSVTSAAMLMIDLMDGATYESAPIEYVYERTWRFKEGTTGSVLPDHPQTEKYWINLWDDVAFNSDHKEQILDPNTAETVIPLYWKLSQAYHGGATFEEKEALKGKISGGDEYRLNSIGLYEKVRSHCDKLIPFLGVEQEWYSTVCEFIRREYFMPDYLVYEFTIQAQNDDPTFGTVNCRLIMKENFDIVLSFVYAGENNENAYAANVYWEAKVTQTTDSKQSKMIYTEDIGQEGNKGTIGTMTTTNSKKINVIWKRENTTVSRGEAATN